MQSWNETPTKTKAKYISILTVAILFIIFIFQNLERVQLDVLFWSFNVRFVFALISCFLMGSLLTYLLLRIKKKNATEEKKKELPKDTQ